MQWMKEQREAVGQVIDDTWAVLTVKSEEPDPLALMTRLGDLARSNSFLSVETSLNIVEHYSRFTHVGRKLSRGLALSALAADLLTGYTVLNSRGRVWNRLAGPQDWELQHQRGAKRVLDTAATLKGTLIKACQFASTRPDILPTTYVHALATLQDRVPAHPWPEIARAIRKELGRNPEDIFQRIEHQPVASASIAQVHRAWLHDGREVAVKVQYPGIAGIIATDLTILQSIVTEIARMMPGFQLQPILDYLKETLPQELDFRREATAMTELRAALQHRTDVLIPEIVPELCTERLLVMDFVNGIKITDRVALEEAGIAPGAVARLLNDVYAEQIFRLGILHADPHPGNLLVQAEQTDQTDQTGPRLVLLDHGLTVHLKPALVQALGEMVQSLVVADFDRLTHALAAAGMQLDEDVDITTLLQLVGVLLGGEQDKDATEASDAPDAPDATNTLDVGVGKQLGKSIGHIPVELILVGRALGLLDGITKQLDPDISALEIVVGYVPEMTSDQP